MNYDGPKVKDAAKEGLASQLLMVQVPSVQIKASISP